MNMYELLEKNVKRNPKTVFLVRENVTFEEVLWFLVSLFDEPSYASSNEMHKKQYLKEHQK